MKITKTENGVQLTYDNKNTCFLGEGLYSLFEIALKYNKSLILDEGLIRGLGKTYNLPRISSLNKLHIFSNRHQDLIVECLVPMTYAHPFSELDLCLALYGDKIGKAIIVEEIDENIVYDFMKTHPDTIVIGTIIRHNYNEDKCEDTYEDAEQCECVDELDEESVTYPNLRCNKSEELDKLKAFCADTEYLSMNDVFNQPEDLTQPSYRTCDVSYKLWDVNSKAFKEVTETGCLFHQWGLEVEEDETGFTNYTVGIVETQSGKIISVMPEQLVFTDRGSLC